MAFSEGSHRSHQTERSGGPLGTVLIMCKGLLFNVSGQIKPQII